MKLDLDKDFKQQEFIDWVSVFLPDFNKDIRKVDVSKNFKGITSIQTIGESPIGVRVYIIETEHDPSRRKVGLATESFTLLREYGTPNALIVYYSEKSKLWRLSLLTSTLIWSEGGIRKTLSNPKRYSFILGEHTKLHTPTDFLIKKGGVISIDDLKSRFSLDVVNKEFYKSIALAYTKLIGGTRKTGNKTVNFPCLLKLDDVKPASLSMQEFAVRLIGRIIFCWFLREIKSKNGTSLIPAILLSSGATESSLSYYHSILSPLFFEVLNHPLESRSDDQFLESPYDKIPYLNGGLFQDQPEDHYKYNTITHSAEYGLVNIPNEWFKEFFVILEQYNFTVDENTSVDIDLSIDPEMLGRIFENLLAEVNPDTGESARKSTGSFYTPRVIVEYMVDESIILYLKQKTGIQEKKLRALISYDLNDDVETPITSDEKQKVIDALYTVTILDPACGSGAFPIGALQKIVYILEQIDPQAEKWFEKQIQSIQSPEFRRHLKQELMDQNFNYIRKMGVIRQSIFGIDIQPIAVEIARLRCFLTLIVEQKVEDDRPNRGIRPLPNLDFKFVAANSLIGLPESNKISQTSLFEDEENISELNRIRQEYFTSPQNERGTLIREFGDIQKKMFKLMVDRGWGSVADLSKKLASWEPFSHKTSAWFDPEWMFGIKNGFDIIIANPPYVGEKGHKELFREVEKSNLGIFHQGRMDLFYYFFHFALNTAKDAGVVSFITTNYFPTATGAKNLRKDIKNRAIVKNLLNFNELKIFESAKGQHNMVSILIKSKDTEAMAHTFITKSKGSANVELLHRIISGVDSNTLYYKIQQKELYDGDEYYIRLYDMAENSREPIQQILNRLKKEGLPLNTICNINNGLRSGIDSINGKGVFVLDNKELNEVLKTKEEPPPIVKRYYKNSDVNKYSTNTNSDLFVIYSGKETNIEQFPQIYKHLLKFKNIIQEKRWGEKVPWFSLVRTRNEKIFMVPKIVSPQRSNDNKFGYNEIPWYAGSDVFYITLKDDIGEYKLKYILSLLNSRLYYLWLYHRGKRKGEALELIVKPLSEIPVKYIPLKEQKPFIEVVDKILAVTKATGDLSNSEKQSEIIKYEKQIDQMVYRLYDLTTDEVDIVEKS